MKIKQKDVDLLIENNHVIFSIKIIILEDHYLKFQIYKILSWEPRGNNSPIESELYLSGSIKWDGCADICFGDEENGYIHLCGKRDLIVHNKVMVKLYEYAEKNIIKYDELLAD